MLSSKPWSKHYIEKISEDFFWKLTVCRCVSECHNHFACWSVSIYLSTFLSVCLCVCMSVCLPICLLFICLASFYQLPLLSVLPSVYLPVCPISVLLSICLYFYLSAYLSVYPYIYLLHVPLSFFLSTVCVSTWQSICWLLPVLLNLYICLSDHLFVYLFYYLSAYTLPSSYQYPLKK